MGGIFSSPKIKQKSVSRGSSRNSSITTRASSSASDSYSYYPQMSKEPSSLGNTTGGTSSTVSQAKGSKLLEKKLSTKQKYAFIPDNFSSLEQVCFACLFFFLFLFIFFSFYLFERILR